MKRNCISDNFIFWNSKDWACNSSPVKNCTLNYDWVLSGNTWIITHIVITFFISLVILKKRTYLSRPSLGIFERDVEKNKAINVCIGMSTLFSIKQGAFLQPEHMVSSWDCCWGWSCSAIVDAGAASFRLITCTCWTAQWLGHYRKFHFTLNLINTLWTFKFWTESVC